MPSLPRTGIQLPFVEDFAWLRFSNDMYPIVRTGYLASARGWSERGVERGDGGEGGGTRTTHQNPRCPLTPG